MDQLADYVPKILRTVTVAGGICVAASDIYNFVFPASYSAFVICVLSGIALGFILACECSSTFYNIILGLVPLLREFQYKGVVYVACSLLTFGPEFGALSQIGSLILLLSGASFILVAKVESARLADATGLSGIRRRHGSSTSYYGIIEGDGYQHLNEDLKEDERRKLTAPSSQKNFDVEANVEHSFVGSSMEQDI